MKRILSLVLVCALALTIVASASAESVVLRMATGYNNAKTGLFFDASIAGEGITLADGVTYNTGDLKPTWVEMQKILSEKTGNDVKFENKYQGNGAAAEFEYWKAQLDQVDMVTGTAATLTEYGVAGNLINLADHMDKLPNFKAYMDANPIVRLSITGDTKTGAIYFAPYFDGVNDIEKMPLMRVDYLQKLLDGEGEFTAESTKDIAAPVYQPYMPTEGKLEIESLNADGTATQKITKDYDAFGNIVAKMNEKGVMSGVEAVNMFREYIDKTYNGYYGTIDILNGNTSLGGRTRHMKENELNVIASKATDALGDACLMLLDSHYGLTLLDDQTYAPASAARYWRINYYPVRLCRGPLYNYPTLSTIHKKFPEY